MPAKLIYFFCHHLDRDPVAPHVFDSCRRAAAFEETAIVVDGFPVVQWSDESDNSVYLVRTHEVVTDRYELYGDLVSKYFADADVAAAVNWHEGANAPDRIFTIHSNADVLSGNFGITDPPWMRTFLRAVEESRLSFDLAEWAVMVEASHWSGGASGSAPELVSSFPVPMFDIEIGSNPTSWAEPRAADVLANALLLAARRRSPVVNSLLCLGGIHFEPAFQAAVFNAREPGHAVSHVLAARWLQSEGYQGTHGIERLRRCVGSIIGGVQAVVYHDGLKSEQKACAKRLAAEMGIPSCNHRALRNAVI